jgi:hypothetical protein
MKRSHALKDDEDLYPAVAVPDDADFYSILSTKRSHWTHGFRDQSIIVAVAQFFHALFDSRKDRIICGMDAATLRAGQIEIPVTFKLSPNERSLLAALRTKDEHSARFHLITLGFLPAPPPQKLMGGGAERRLNEADDT